VIITVRKKVIRKQSENSRWDAFSIIGARAEIQAEETTIKLQ